MFDKPYDPKTTEESIYTLWEHSGYFNPDNLAVKKSAKNYIVYMPLPNVTGSLHMGHALDNVTPDILIRYKRMKGFRTLWLPGTDHAGIATQFVVEKQLKKEGTSRFELGREKFIARVWEWKKEYGGKILEQLKKLGVSADWSRARFTMDAAYAADVMKAFVHYHKKGWIYRGFRTVNWCPRCGTSLSELELEYKDEETKLWYIKYDLQRDANISRFYRGLSTESERMHTNNTNYEGIVVATTRPETMLGDTAIAVHPKDARYKSIVGKTVILPLTGRTIPIVADDAIDREFGTGAVKVTPAHDITDFEIGARHKLPTIQVIDGRGRMTKEAGPAYEGLKVLEAREKVVVALEEEGRMVKIEPYPHRVAVCYRCNSVIEPIPSAQWFLKMETMAKAALAAVKTKKVAITPKNFERPYRDWLSNIRDWTISRQIWWGHRLPVWQCKCQTEENSKFEIRNSKLHQEPRDIFVVSVEKPNQKCKECGGEYEQVPDVLDTWFSSALWPFAGFSEEDKKKYYPGDLVSNAREILNLWDARMIYSGLEFMGKVPFKNVLIHGTVLTKDGKRMSKSLGTGIDPLQYIEQFGADATRFAVVWQATGQDIRWDEAAAVAGKKFCNKLWNAARFVREHSADVRGAKPQGKTAADKRILQQLAAAKKNAAKHIEKFEFAAGLRELYDFFWHEFCDVYVERSKQQLADAKRKKNTEAVLAHVLISSLKLLHPFLPFITEDIYRKLPGRAAGELLIIAPW
ncbi:MAG: valine--tRNA ligase [Candidatus Jorgensenbacteria bacterium]